MADGAARRRRLGAHLRRRGRVVPARRASRARRSRAASAGVRRPSPGPRRRVRGARDRPAPGPRGGLALGARHRPVDARGPGLGPHARRGAARRLLRRPGPRLPRRPSRRPASAVGFEGFEVGGATYIYYGPVLALLRLPVLLATHRSTVGSRSSRCSSRSSSCSSRPAHLYERVRGLCGPGAAVGGGRARARLPRSRSRSAPAASPCTWPPRRRSTRRPSCGAQRWPSPPFGAIVAVLERPTVARVLCAGLLATLAVNTRVSVGLGPIVALGRADRRRGRGPARAARARAVGLRGQLRAAGAARRCLVVALAVATLVPLASSAAVNQAKFDRPFGLPMDKQVATRLDANRRAALAANDGTIFGPQFVPTTLLAAARPDAVGSLRAFPFVGLPARPSARRRRRALRHPAAQPQRPDLDAAAAAC